MLRHEAYRAIGLEEIPGVDFDADYYPIYCSNGCGTMGVTRGPMGIRFCDCGGLLKYLDPKEA